MTIRLMQNFDAFVASGANRRCGICHSTNLNPEDRPTKFSTMDEARPFLQAMADAQAATRKYLEASKG